MVETSNPDAVIDQLTIQEKKFLLRLAREALVMGVRGDPLTDIDSSFMTPKLIQLGATFVTLTRENVQTVSRPLSGTRKAMMLRKGYTLVTFTTGHLTHQTPLEGLAKDTKAHQITHPCI